MLPLLFDVGTAHAYLGPGLGLGGIGVALGIVGSILLGCLSIIWYPAKRLIRSLRRKTPPRKSEPSEDQ